MVERSVFSRRCLHQRILTQDELTVRVAVWVAERNKRRATADRQFSLEKAHTKLGRHHQKIRVPNSPD